MKSRKTSSLPEQGGVNEVRGRESQEQLSEVETGNEKKRDTIPGPWSQFIS